ncbi:hypothetical protein NO1_0516, partial [Candidatus Termititenax aidoneus]
SIITAATAQPCCPLSTGLSAHFTSLVALACEVRGGAGKTLKNILQELDKRNKKEGYFLVKTGNVLLSNPVARAVSSALIGLTAVFGMGTGVSLSLSSPESSPLSDMLMLNIK